MRRKKTLPNAAVMEGGVQIVGDGSEILLLEKFFDVLHITSPPRNCGRTNPASISGSVGGGMSKNGGSDARDDGGGARLKLL